MRDGSELLNSLIDGTLEPGGFSHRDHLAAACEVLNRFEFFEAVLVFANGLRSLTERAGVPEKFNATVTLTFMSLLAEKMEGGTTDADVLLQEHPDLLGPGLMGRWYSPERLSGNTARKFPVMPDRVA